MDKFRTDNWDFEIYIEVKRRTYHMQVHLVYQGDSYEKFKVKGGQRHIILQSNRPFLKSHHKKDNIDWKLVEGDLSNSNPKDAADALAKITEAIENYTKDMPITFNISEDARKH